MLSTHRSRHVGRSSERAKSKVKNTATMTLTLGRGDGEDTITPCHLLYG
jgi:hypothetical protein